jgi:RimJ/RimL family protein N-acetyltransferase
VIFLRQFTQADIPRLIRWVDSLDALLQWAGPTQFSFPLTEKQLLRYVEECRGNMPIRRAYAGVDASGEVIGHIELGAINYGGRMASLCRVLIAPGSRGKGYCLPMIHSVLQIGFRELRMRRIDLRVYGFNTAAIQCYEKAGFVREGLLRKAQLIAGQYCDVVIMGILEEEWVDENQQQEQKGT